MIFSIPAPPPLTGDGAADSARLSSWCRLLHTALKRTLGTFENELAAAADAKGPESEENIGEADTVV